MPASLDRAVSRNDQRLSGDDETGGGELIRVNERLYRSAVF